MILVADASALIALSACNSLQLLDALFGTVLAKEAVYREVANEGKPHAEPLRRYLQAKRAGLVASFAPLLAQIDASPVFISRNLLETVLEWAGESDALRP